MDKIYNSSGRKENLDSFTDQEILEMSANLVGGVPMATPVFDGASEDEIRTMLRLWQIFPKADRSPYMMA